MNKETKPFFAEEPKTVRAANVEYLQKRRGRLKKNTAAMEWLRAQGVSDETIDHFKLGLSESYSDRGNALLAPVIDGAGIFTKSSIYVNIAGVTRNPQHNDRWMSGAPATYHSEKSEGHVLLLVLNDPIELWLTFQMLAPWRNELNMLLICSTHPGEIPAEWRKSEFWRQYERIFICYPGTAAADEAAIRLTSSAGHEMRRMRLPFSSGEGLRHFWSKGWSVEEFYRILSESVVIGAPLAASNAESGKLGRFGYEPVEIAGAFHRGHLYYPALTHVRSLSSPTRRRNKESARPASRIETVVIRSDRTQHTVKVEPAPYGTPASEKVMRLSDGTVLGSPPAPPLNPTWSRASIEDYIMHRSVTKPLKSLLKEVKTFLKNSVRLPFDSDYDLLTLLVPVTFAQAIFHAVPLVSVTGPQGSGKKAIGRSMTRICANGVAVGQTSALEVARIVHAAAGFIWFDDFGRAAQYSKRESVYYRELGEQIELSWNKGTVFNLAYGFDTPSVHSATSGFGVKMFTSRDETIREGRHWLTVSTYHSPPGASSLPTTPGTDQMKRLSELRDDLHTWTFENVALIDSVYQRLCSSSAGVSSDPFAPLRAFAEISGDKILSYGLENALEKNQENEADPSDPVDVMICAVKKLIRQGYEELSTSHVLLEMKALAKNAYRSVTISDGFNWADPSWVGRQLRTHGLIEINAEAKRHNLFGRSIRVYPVKPGILKEVFNENSHRTDVIKKDPLEFCLPSCRDCRYKQFNCPFIQFRK